MMLKCVQCLCYTSLMVPKFILVFLLRKMHPFKQCMSINQISTMMLMGPHAVIFLNRHGQQHSWKLCTNLLCAQQIYAGDSLKENGIFNYSFGIPNLMYKSHSLGHDEVVNDKYAFKTRLNHFILKCLCQR